MLLARYGVLFRDVLIRESNAPKWRDLLGILRRLEARGEVRGGRFVTGFSGEQFALPEAVESLRERSGHEGGAGRSFKGESDGATREAGSTEPVEFEVGADQDVFDSGVNFPAGNVDWRDASEIARIPRQEKRFEPTMAPSQAATLRERWNILTLESVTFR